MEKYPHIKMITGTNPLKGDVNKKHRNSLLCFCSYVKDERKDFFLEKMSIPTLLLNTDSAIAYGCCSYNLDVSKYFFVILISKKYFLIPIMKN